MQPTFLIESSLLSTSSSINPIMSHRLVIGLRCILVDRLQLWIGILQVSYSSDVAPRFVFRCVASLPPFCDAAAPWRVPTSSCPHLPGVSLSEKARVFGAGQGLLAPIYSFPPCGQGSQMLTLKHLVVWSVILQPGHRCF